MAIEIRSTTVKPAGAADMRVEILLSDNIDIERSLENVSLTVRVPSQAENPTLTEVRLAALRRARVLIDESMSALAPRSSAD
jgi:hypothetical protein